MQASLLAKLRAELGDEDPAQFADAAQRLAEEFGSVTATAVDAAWRTGRPRAGARRRAEPHAHQPV